MTTILLAGATGMLGNRIATHLLDDPDVRLRLLVRAGALDDPRVRVVAADLLSYLASDAGSYDAICLDIDNGPEWTVTASNRALYDAAGLALAARRLRPGGVLAVWSAAESSWFAGRLRGVFSDVEVLPVPVARGVPDVVYVARTPKGD